MQTMRVDFRGNSESPQKNSCPSNWRK